MTELEFSQAKAGVPAVHPDLAPDALGSLISENAPIPTALLGAPSP